MEVNFSFWREMFQAWKVLLEWELLRSLNLGWQVLGKLVGLISVIAVVIFLEPVLGESYFPVLLPGLATLFLLHPFLYSGEFLTRRFELPGSWRAVPVSLDFFIYAGIIPRFIMGLVGFVIFYLLLGGLGYSELFFLTPVYWILFLGLIPGAIGLGLLTHSLDLLAGTETGMSMAGRRVVELLGLVFVLPHWLPPGFYHLHFIFPHSYLAGFGRAAWNTGQFSAWYYSSGVIVSFLLLAAGITTFSFVLDKTIQRGYMDRHEW